MNHRALLFAGLVLGCIWSAVPPSGVAIGLRPAQDLTATPEPSPRVSATYTASPDTTATPTVVPSVTATPTDRPSPTATSTGIPAEGHPSLALPTARSVVSPTFLTADLVGLLGELSSSPSIAFDGSHAAVMSHGRLWFLRLDSPDATVLGSTILDATTVNATLLGLVGSRAVLVDATRVSVVDLSRPGDPNQVVSFYVGIAASQMATDGDLLYLVGYVVGGPDRQLRLDILSGWASASPKPVSQTPLGTEFLQGMVAGEGRLFLNLGQPPRQPESIRWQLFDTSQASRPRLMATAPSEAWAMGISGGRVLIVDRKAVRVQALASPLASIPIASWTSDAGEPLWARFASDSEILSIATTFSPIRDPVAARLVRLIMGGDGRMRSISYQDLPMWTRWAGSTGLCYLESVGDGATLCVRGAGQTSALDLDDLLDDPELKAPSDWFMNAVAIGPDILVASGSQFKLLVTDPASGAWRLAALHRMERSIQRLYSEGGQLYVQSDHNHLVSVAREGDSWRLADLIGVGDLIAVGEGLAALVIPHHIGAVSNQVRILDLGSRSLRFETSVDNLDFAVPPVIASGRLWLAGDDGSTVVVDLAGSPSDARPVVRWPGVALRQLAVRDGLAYVARSALPGPDNRPGLALEVYDWSAGRPALVNRIESLGDVPLDDPSVVRSMLITSREIIVDRGSGWLTRLSLADRIAPVVLSPYLAADPFPQVTLVDDRRLALISRNEELAFASVDGSQEAVHLRGWSPWRGSLEGPLALVEGQLHVSRWVYDLATPRTPRRLEILEQNSMEQAGTAIHGMAATVYALFDHEVRGFALRPGLPPVLVNRWCGLGGLCLGPNAQSFRALAVADGTVFAFPADGTLLALADRGPDERPRSLGTWRMAGFDGEAMRGLFVLGKLLIAYPGADGPFAMDISDPGRPRPMGTIPGLPGPISHVVGRDSLAIVAIGNELISLEIDPAGQLRAVDRLVLSGPIMELDSDGRFVYATQAGGIWRVESDSVGRLTDPEWLALPATGSLVVSQDHFYLTYPYRRQVEIWSNIRPAVKTEASPSPAPTVTPTRSALWLPCLEQRRQR